MESLTLKLIPPLQKVDGGAFACRAQIRRALGKEPEEVALRLSLVDYKSISQATPEGVRAWDVTWLRVVDKGRTTWTISPIPI